MCYWFLAERGLAFRGTNNLIDVPWNGSFLGILELIGHCGPSNMSVQYNIYSAQAAINTTHWPPTCLVLAIALFYVVSMPLTAFQS